MNMKHLTRREALGEMIALPLAAWLGIGLGSENGRSRVQQISESGREENPRHIILISVDSLRADHVGCYGYGKDTTPNIDALASGGVRFDDAIAPCSWTVPSHASLFTSLYPPAHGVVDVTRALPRKCITLAEVLREEGYVTAAFVSSKNMMAAQYGFDQGFDLYDDYSVPLILELDGLGPHDGTTSAEVNEIVGKWVDSHRREKFFLFVHYWDVHYTYGPSQRHSRMFVDESYDGPYRHSIQATAIREGMRDQDLEQANALYDGEIRCVDEHIGLLMERLQHLGMWEDTVLIVLSDHGDEFLDHGGSAHGHTLYDELLEVPLVFAGPGIPKGRTVPSQVSLVDVYPTVLHLAGTECAWPIQGRSFVDWMSSSVGVPRIAYAETQLDGPVLRCVRTKNAKHIVAQDGAFESYDLESDPGEQTNLAHLSTERSGHLREQLLQFTAHSRQIRRAVGATEEEQTRSIDPETLERLKALGYVR